MIKSVMIQNTLKRMLKQNKPNYLMSAEELEDIIKIVDRNIKLENSIKEIKTVAKKIIYEV